MLKLDMLQLRDCRDDGTEVKVSIWLTLDYCTVDLWIDVLGSESKLNWMKIYYNDLHSNLDSEVSKIMKFIDSTDDSLSHFIKLFFIKGLQTMDGI